MIKNTVKFGVILSLVFMLMRYVESNPLKAGLAEKAGQWPPKQLGNTYRQ